MIKQETQTKTGNTKHKTQNKTYTIWGDKMSENNAKDYWDEKDEGHVDTREDNFKCDEPDPNLGCDMGIDVAG